MGKHHYEGESPFGIKLSITQTLDYSAILSTTATTNRVPHLPCPRHRAMGNRSKFSPWLVVMVRRWQRGKRLPPVNHNKLCLVPFPWISVKDPPPPWHVVATQQQQMTMHPCTLSEEDGRS